MNREEHVLDRGGNALKSRQGPEPLDVPGRIPHLRQQPVRSRVVAGRIQRGHETEQGDVWFGDNALLLRRRGEVLSRTIISELVWEMHFDSDTNVVDVAIRRLRAKVDDAFPIKLIRSVRGVGYVLDQA